MQKTCIERRKISLVKDVKTRTRLKEKVIKIVDIGVKNLWGPFKDEVLGSCDELCGRKRGRKHKGDRWSWNEEMTEAISRKIDAHKVVITDDNKNRYENMKNKARNVASKAMKDIAEEALADLKFFQNILFELQNV